VIASAKIIKHKVVMHDDVCGGQYSIVPRKVGIARERNVIAETGSTSASGVHTILGSFPQQR
jgi:hypothetical protein